MRDFKIIAGVTVLAAVLVLAGCKGKESDEESGEMVLHHVLPTKIKSLDPVSMRDVYSASVSGQFFETLYEYHFLKRPYVLKPLLAEDMPEVSEDRLTYTVRIKKGVLYQDDVCFEGGRGRELKAGDFVYGVKRVANIKNISENWSLFDNRIVGLDEFREYTKTCEKAEDVDYSRPIKGLQTPDDYTLVIRLKKPWPQMVGTALADRVTAPVAREAVDYYGKDIISHPVGTGPYMLKEWRRGSFIELVRNPNFRGEAYPNEGEPGDSEAGLLDDAGKTMPFTDKVIWTIVEETQPAWLMFMQGKIDTSPIYKDNYNEVFSQGTELSEKMKQLGIKLEIFDDPSTFWVGFNMDDPVLGKNKPLRLAINRAIDREKFIELFFNGRHKVAHGFVAPLMDSYDPSINDRGYARYDPDEGRRLVKEAEQIYGGKLPELKLAVPGTDTFGRQMGQFLKRQLNDAGLDVDVQYMDWPTYQEKISTSSAQMFFSGVSASISDAEDFLGLFYGPNKAPGSNKFNYSNPEYDSLYDEATIMNDGDERRAIYRKMEIMVLKDCPAAFLNHRVAFALRHEWYKNYKPHAFAYGVSKYRRIDMKKRAEYKELLKKVK